VYSDHTIKASPVSTLCWQIHRGLTVPMPLLRVWVHCPRASNGLLPRRSNLVAYVRWDARSDRFPPCQTIIPTAFRSHSGLPTTHNLTDQTTSKGWFLLEICRDKRDCSYLPTGTLRRNSSEKFIRKVTLFCAFCSSAVSTGISATMRLPSGARSTF
jgi:hypothetical protein